MASHRNGNWDNGEETEVFYATTPDQERPVPRRALIDLGHWGKAERITAIICFTFFLIVLTAGVLS